MDFRIPPATQALLDRVEAVMHEAVYPLEPAFLSQRFSAVEPLLREARKKVKAAGLWAPQAPQDVGGLGLALTEFALVSEHLGQSPLGHYAFGCQAPDAGNIELLHRHGTPAQREEYLLPLTRGEVRSCFAMTEPDSPGSNPTQLRTRARIDGDHYVIEGHKWFTSSADGAAFAIVMAVTEPEAPPHKRASMILCRTDTPGFVRVRNIPVMGEANDGFASHAEVRLTGCRVPVTNRIGAAGSGFALAQERLGPGRIHHCMRWLGICERAFRLMCQRAVARKIDDHEALAHKQIIQAFIAESRAEIDAARLLVLRTAARIDEDERAGRHGFHAAQEDVSLIKFHVANVLQRVVDRAIQVHGALGITNDTVLAYFYGHERGARIYDGPDEVHKIAAARRILKRFEAAQDPAAGPRHERPERKE
jgi:alkylation response protein AidB-like acyl-CoA dehydrogenase